MGLLGLAEISPETTCESLSPARHFSQREQLCSLPSSCKRAVWDSRGKGLSLRVQEDCGRHIHRRLRLSKEPKRTLQKNNNLWNEDARKVFNGRKEKPPLLSVFPLQMVLLPIYFEGRIFLIPRYKIIISYVKSWETLLF